MSKYKIQKLVLVDAAFPEDEDVQRAVVSAAMRTESCRLLRSFEPEEAYVKEFLAKVARSPFGTGCDWSDTAAAITLDRVAARADELAWVLRRFANGLAEIRDRYLEADERVGDSGSRGEVLVVSPEVHAAFDLALSVTTVHREGPVTTEAMAAFRRAIAAIKRHSAEVPALIEMARGIAGARLAGSNVSPEAPGEDPVA